MIKNYLVIGYFIDKGKKQPFRKEVRGLSEEHAREKIYSIISSNHKVKRRFIKFLEIKEISPDEITDPTLKLFATNPEEVTLSKERDLLR